ncbi:MAG: hypothetical protein ABJG47_00275 [Ekhidna sp.]
MKKLLFIAPLVFAVFLTSCSKDDDGGTDLIASLDIDSEITQEANYEDIDLIVEAGMETVETGGRISQDAVLECATVTHDEENKTVTIDYGDGCEGPGGRIRAGIIRISYSDHRLVPGAFRTTTFDGFSVDEVLVEGTRTVENVSESLDADPAFSISLVGGKLTFEDETTATRESQRTRTWFRASNPLNDETSIEGGSNGTRRDGVSYSVEILSRIIYKRACRANRVFIPVAGIKQYTSGDNIAVVDYGDGTCDNEVTITVNGGDPVTKTLTPKGRR